MCNLSEAIEVDAKIEAYYTLVMDNLLAPEEAAKRLGMTVEEFMQAGKYLSEAN